MSDKKRVTVFVSSATVTEAKIASLIKGISLSDYFEELVKKDVESERIKRVIKKRAEK